MQPQRPGHAAGLFAREGVAADLRGQEPRRGQVQFFDTKDCALGQSSMLLRARMPPGKDPSITLKIRSADILIADMMPVTLADGKTVEFEDDYGIGPDGTAGSDYSRSLSYDGSVPKTIAELTQNFDHLTEVMSAAPTAELLSGPLIDTVVYASKPYPLGPDTAVKVETSLWYSADDGSPLAGDVSFTLEAPFDYATVLAARDMLTTLSDGLGEMRGASAEKALAALPEICQ